MNRSSRLSPAVAAFAAGALLALPVAASDLDLSVESAGTNTITVGPGDAVSWSVVGELSDASNEGLAMFAFDLSFDGGDLVQGTTPVAAPMDNFAVPLGLNNPAGFGGTLVDGDLVQVGGAQNTIKNAFAAYPIGNVITGLAQPGLPETLATGTLTAPLDPGTYTLKLDSALANVIRENDTGNPFWAVDGADIGTVTDLTVEVVALTGDVESVSIAGLETQVLSLDAGLANAGRDYLILGTFTGTDPGITLGTGVNIPVNFDFYTTLTIDLPGVFVTNGLGTLDGFGEATAAFTVFPGTPAAAAGITLHHAFLLLNPKDYASNAVPLLLAP